MPAFPTPAPIDLAVTVQVGGLHVIASDRSDTVVTVSPTTPTRPEDRRAAEQTRVQFDGQRLEIVGPKPRFAIIGPTESIDVKVELPAGSRLTASVGWVRTEGRLGATRVKSTLGYVDIDASGDLWLRAMHGNATVGRADGAAEIVADHGQIHVGSIAGDATLKASHGSVHITECGGDVEAKLSYGDFEIGTAGGSVTAKTAYGEVRIGEVSSGAIDVESGYGRISIGVRPGVAAWLDLSSKDGGRVRNQLDGDRAPARTEQSIAVRARTRAADIDIQRAH